MIDQSLVAALNHLLVNSGWALPRLAKFKGKTARFNVAPFSFSCTILEDGSLLTAASEESADAVLRIPLSLAPRLAMKDQAALDEIETEGDPALLGEILYLMYTLHWDAAEDLSRVTGDVAAERIVQLALAKKDFLQDTALNLAQALAEYWTEEKPLVAKPPHVDDLSRQVDAVSKKLTELERRIDNLLDKNK
jgi:ubiquinone biosynthesis protein UbiJ